MQELVNWLGKADDMKISYDVGFNGTPLLTDGASETLCLPAEIYTQSENERDVVDVSWETSVKKADKADYIIAVCCGTIAGLVDSFYVGEFSIERANTWGDEQVNKFVMKVAKLNGYKGDDLSGAVSFLEKRFPFASDGNTPDFGGGKQHHLRDFSHHFSLGGLLCSLFTQFSDGLVIGTDTLGNLKVERVKNKALIGKNFEEKILFGTVNWFFHMVSDMAGSNATAGKGTGIPGPIVSFIKEMSALPCFKDKKINDIEFRTWISKLFNGTLLAKRDGNGAIKEPIKFDLRTEIGILHEIGRQFIPVLINECMVRGLYFIRRLYSSISETNIQSISDLKKIDTSELLPFNNRSVIRMVTIASGTFTAVDTVDAAVRSVIKNRGINAGFVVDFALRINIVGIGRFIIACKADSKYIVEDISDARKEKAVTDKMGQEYEKTLSDLKCFTLDYIQLRVLYSIERLIISEDIADTDNHEERNLKQKWQIYWEKQLLTSLPIPDDEKDNFFMPEDKIINYLVLHNQEGTWMYLVAMEATLFKPYYPIHGDDRDKEYKGLKFKSKYLEEHFSKSQQYLSKAEFSSFKKTYKKAGGIITGSTKNMVIGAGVTVAVILATGGMAYAFAPAIAVALAGDSAAGLSGAALVSYSLAAVGGGSLAAGGLGMAGGTAIITGGGALVGMLGGTSMSAATTLALLSDDGYVLGECCKLLTFSKEVLIEKNNDISSVQEIELSVGSRIGEIEHQLETFESDEEKGIELKKKIKIAKKSLKYLKRCDDELKRSVNTSSVL